MFSAGAWLATVVVLVSTDHTNNASVSRQEWTDVRVKPFQYPPPELEYYQSSQPSCKLTPTGNSLPRQNEAMGHMVPAASRDRTFAT